MRISARVQDRQGSRLREEEEEEEEEVGNQNMCNG